MTDPDFHDGHFYEYGVKPARGLRVARMIGHITYISDEQMGERFGRQLRDGLNFSFAPEFEIESYLRYQGEKFAEYFDANTYLRITKALDYFDPAVGHRRRPDAGARAGGAAGFWSSRSRPTGVSRRRARARSSRRWSTIERDVCYAEIVAPHGHDAFLLDTPQYHAVVRAYLARALRSMAQLSYATRADFSTIAGWVAADARACSTWAAATAASSRTFAIRAARRGYGIEIDDAGVLASIGNGINVHPERPGKRTRGIRRSVIRQRDPVADAAGDAPHRSRSCSRCCASGARRSSPSRTSATGRTGCRFCAGRMPVSKNLPYQWYDTPNIHLCTVADFDAFCASARFDVLDRVVLHDARRVDVLPNLFGVARHLSLPARARSSLRSRGCGAFAYNAGDGRLQERRWRRAVQPADADLRLHRLQLRACRSTS